MKKRRSLADLSRGSYASGRAIERLLADVRNHGIPEATSRRSLYRARKAEANLQTPYGPLVQSFVLPLSSGPETVAVQHPLGILHVVCAECPAFSSVLRDALQRQPPSGAAPWRLVLYCDEIGHNPLGRDNRKCEAIYWSFLELGTRALHLELGWFEVMVVRTRLVEELPGGMSHLLRLLLNNLFFNQSNGSNLETGVHLQDGLPLLFAKFACFVADEKAIKEVWCNKGASGFRCCPICYNVCFHRASEVARVGSVLSTCTETSELRYHTDDSVRDVLREVRDIDAQYNDGAISKLFWERNLKLLGWNHVPQGLLSDARLRIGAITTLMHCWVHIYIVNGLFNTEMQFLLVFWMQTVSALRRSTHSCNRGGGHATSVSHVIYLPRR